MQELAGWTEYVWFKVYSSVVFLWLTRRSNWMELFQKFCRYERLWKTRMEFTLQKASMSETADAMEFQLRCLYTTHLPVYNWIILSSNRCCNESRLVEQHYFLRMTNRPPLLSRKQNLLSPSMHHPFLICALINPPNYPSLHSFCFSVTLTDC